MATNTIKDAVLFKKVEGIVYEIAMKTGTGNVVDATGRTLATILTSILADIAVLPTSAQVDQRIKDIVASAPAALDTLKEIADALNNDPNFATSITNLLGTKVDKIAGKGLSTIDFTAALKTKLDGLVNYTHPTTHPAAMITEDATHRFVTDAQKTKIDNSVNYIHPVSHPASMITENDTHRFVTDAERAKIAVIPRILSGATVPADLTENDLFLQVV